MLVWDAGELFFVGLPDQAQNLSILVVSAMLEVKWLDTNAGTNPQMAVPTPESEQSESQQTTGSVHDHLQNPDDT